MEKPRSNAGSSGSRPGRPSVPDHKKKKSRTLTISDKAWESLEELLKDWEIKSVSELVEKIGLEQLGVFLPSGEPSIELTDIPIYKRLKSFIQPPVAVFWSLLAFAKRTALQLGLPDDEVFLGDVVKRAIAVVFYAGYTHPDLHINNPSALLRWVSYRILKAKAAEAQTLVTTARGVLSAGKSREQCLVRILNAIEQLNAASQAPHYRVLKMKALDQLTTGQIIKIFELQSYHKDESQIGRMIKKGLHQFRQLWATQDYTPEPNDTQDTPTEICSEVRLYYALATAPSLCNEENLIQLEKILLTTSSDTPLDFWMNEIDHYCGFALSHEPESYAAQQEKLRQSIDQEIDEYLSRKKAEIDQRLSSCSNKDELEELLSKAVKKEIGSDFPINTLLEPRLNDFVNMINHLEEMLGKDDIKTSLERYIESLKKEIF